MTGTTEGGNRSEEDALELCLDRVRSTCAGVESAFPYYADPETGTWTTTADGNWCGGHWIGLLWLAHDRTGEDRFAERAREQTETMIASIPRDNMFYGVNYHYAGFRAYDVTGDPDHRDLGVDGADAMVEYFHEGARQIPLGTLEIESPSPEFRGPESGGGPSGARLGAVDAIYTSLPVLWRAYRETDDPRYRDVAISHADRHLDWYVREDGSTWHHAEFDPETGELLRQYNELAYSDETCWARGQGWCIAGLARAYAEAGAKRYLDALADVVDYYVAHAPDDLVPFWDFEHPDAPDVPRDTSAAALAAYGLTRLPEEDATGDLRDIGKRILASLIEGYLTPRESNAGSRGTDTGMGMDTETGTDTETDTETTTGTGTGTETGTGTGTDTGTGTSIETRTDTEIEDDRPRGMLLEGCYNGPSGFANRHELVWSDYYLTYALDYRCP